MLSGRSAPFEGVMPRTPAVVVAAAAVDVLVVVAPALLPASRGSAVVPALLVLPTVLVAGHAGRRWIAAQSLVVVASCVGVLVTAAPASLSTAAIAVVVSAAVLAAASVVVALRRALEQEVARARAHATLDPLTAAVNRRGLEDAGVALIHHGRRDARTVGAIMIDVDDFKAVNDAFGHQAGDRVLQEVCDAIRSCVRSGDVVARLGGEEFAVLTVLPPADLAELGERIRRRVAQRCGNVAVTASLGVTWADLTASHPHRDLQGMWRLIDRADALMYLAKSQGRDRVCLEGVHG